MSRTLQTMAPLAAALDMRPEVKTLCYEVGGCYESDAAFTTFQGRGGLSQADMAAAFPNFDVSAVGAEGWYDTSKKRESDDVARKRVCDFADWLRNFQSGLTADRSAVLVAHHDFICVLLDELVQGRSVSQPVVDASQEVNPHGREGFRGWRHFNAAFSVLSLGDSPSIIAVNVAEHLLHDKNLVTGCKF